MLSPRGPRDPVRQQVDISAEKLKSGVSWCPGWQRQSEQAEQVKKKKFCSGVQGCWPVRSWNKVIGEGVQSELTGSGRVSSQNQDPKWAGQPSAKSRGERGDGAAPLVNCWNPMRRVASKLGPGMVLGSEWSEERSGMITEGLSILYGRAREAGEATLSQDFACRTRREGVLFLSSVLKDYYKALTSGLRTSSRTGGTRSHLNLKGISTISSRLCLPPSLCLFCFFSIYLSRFCWPGQGQVYLCHSGNPRQLLASGSWLHKIGMRRQIQISNFQ